MTTNLASSRRILHFIDTGGPGGAETVFVTLAVDGARRQQNACVVLPYDGWLANRLRENGIGPTFVPAKQGMSPRLVLLLARLARSTNATTIQAHLLGSGIYASLAGLLLGLPVIVVFHGATDLQSPGSLESLKRWLLGRRHVTLVAVSDAVRDAMVEWGLARDKIELIQNGVDTRAYSPGPSDSLQRELGLPSGTRLIGAVGNLRPAKSYETLATAAQLVLAKAPDVHFILAGSGKHDDRRALELQLESLGIRDRFHLLGFRQSSAALYRSLTIFVSSARSEGLPLSFLEAMACGIPIAATSNGGSGPLLAQTGAGLLSPIDDPPSLGRSIVSLLENPVLARQLGEKGREAVVSDFSLAKTLTRYRAIHESVSTHSRQPSDSLRPLT